MAETKYKSTALQLMDKSGPLIGAIVKVEKEEKEPNGLTLLAQ